MSCIASLERSVIRGKPVPEQKAWSAFARRTRNRQAAVMYLRSAAAADSVAQRSYLRRLAAQLLLSDPRVGAFES